MSEKTPRELGGRERQIVETVLRLGEASVSEVLQNLVEPPSYSAVRTMLGLLVKKGWLKYRRDGKRYLYRSAGSREKSQRSAVLRMLGTFFDGSTGDAVAALLDVSSDGLSDEELNRLTEMIQMARKKQKP